MVIHQIMMVRAHVWIWHDEAVETQPTEPTQPAAASGEPHHSDFTPKEIGTWAAEQMDSTTLCQAYQRKQCANSHCPREAHACTVVLRASGFTCGLKHPACTHKLDIKAVKQAGQAKKLEQSTAVGLHSINQSPDQGHQTAEKDTRQQPISPNLHAGNSVSSSAKPVPPRGAPPRVATRGSEIEATQRTEVREHQCSSEVRGDADSSDKCAPPHVVDIFAGRRRPMSRAMEWCGWTTSSCERFPVDCRCGWECRCGKAKDVRSDGVQTEILNRMQKAQATWIALDSCTPTRGSSPITGQGHLPKPLRSAEELWGRTSLEPNRYSREKQQTRGSEPLSAEERGLLLEHNDPIAPVGEALKIIHEAHELKVQQLGIVENPENSRLWSCDFMKASKRSQDTAGDEGWTDDDYMSCFCESSRSKRQRLRTSMHSAKEALSVEGMASAQCHDQHPQEWNPRTRQEEGEFPARFVWQMAVAISCEAANKFQLRLRVPRSPALQPMIGGDRSWWTLLPASAVSELTMAPIGLQLMLCPPRDEGHTSPVIYGPTLHHLSKRAACCGIRTAERWQSKAAFLNPFEGDRGEEVAILKYIIAWSRMTSTEQLVFVSSLVGRVLVTNSMPGSISHAHFVAAMVADYVKKENISWDQLSEISTHINQIPHAEPAPHTQEVAGMRRYTTVKLKSRGIGQPRRKRAIKLAFNTEPDAGAAQGEAQT